MEKERHQRSKTFMGLMYCREDADDESDNASLRMALKRVICLRSLGA